LLSQEKRLGIDWVNFDGRTYLRFQLFSPHVVPTKDVAAEYATMLKEEGKLIETTLAFRKVFADAVDVLSPVTKTLKNVHVDEGWFGLGAVRYTPGYIKEDSLSPEIEKDVNDLNALIVDKLTEQDPNLFKRGLVRGTTRTCVLIGVVSSSPPRSFRVSLQISCLFQDRSQMTAENAQQLAGIINGVAADMERSDRFIGGLAAVIKKGIQQAESEIKKESDQRDQGLLKQIPIVGSFLGMFSSAPESPKTNAVKSFEIGKGLVPPCVLSSSIFSPFSPFENEIQESSIMLRPPPNLRELQASPKLCTQRSARWPSLPSSTPRRCALRCKKRWPLTRR